MFSQDSNHSERVESEEMSSVALQTIQYTVCPQETALTKNKTVAENSASESSSSESLEISTIKNLSSQGLQANGDTSWEDANTSSHNPVSSYGITQNMLADSLQTIRLRETKTFSTAKKQVNFLPSRQDPRLQSASYANHLFKTKTSLTSYTCETPTQSTYFSNDPNLQPGSSKQIKGTSHTMIHTELNVQPDEPSNSALTNITSNQTNQWQSTDMFNTQSTSDLRQSQIGLNFHSKQTELNSQPNSQYTTCMKENINVLSKNPNCLNSLNQNKTYNVSHLTSLMCINTSDTSKKQTTSSSAILRENMIVNSQSSTQPPDNTLSSTLCTLTLENPLQISNTTKQHKNENVRKTESSVIKNPYGVNSSRINVKKGKEKSPSSIKSQTIHKVKSRTKVKSNGSTQTQNPLKPSVIHRNENQVENFQQLLHKPQEMTSESQCSDHFGLTQSLLTQSEQGSFIFGIKRIWSHSASEFVPNYQLPEGFWKNKATPIPEDLLQALENW
jgi:hypothetical protein